MFENNGEIYLSHLLREAKKSLQETGNPEKKNGVTYALFGSSGSGKSTLIRKIFIDDLYKNEPHVKSEDEFITILFTESKHADPLKKIDQDDLILDSCGVDEEIYKWMYNMNYRYDKCFNFNVMIDDVITVKTYPTVFKAFLTYRNMNITSVVSLQYLKLCPLAVRSSLYFCFLLPSNSNEGIEQLVKGYMSIYLPGKTLNEKIAKYKMMATKFHFFLIDNLNHKCYYVDNNYFATEMKQRPMHERLDFGPSEEEKQMMKEVEGMSANQLQNLDSQPEKKRRKTTVL